MTNLSLYEWARQRGYQVGIGRIDLLQEVSEELEQRKTEKEIDPYISREYLNFDIDFRETDEKRSSSVIVVVVPRPAHIIGFTIDDKLVETILPPTYLGYRRLFETIRQDLRKNVFNGQKQVKTISAPLKALAHRLGIVSYGRNNLTYTREYGSYQQLAGYLVNTLLPLPKPEFTNAQTKQMLPECVKCKACSEACPMGVISQEHFLIHAEKCYTRYSESLSPLPDEIQPPSPDCIIGCMQCQKICPVNKGRLKYQDTGIIFSSEEIRAILEPKLMHPQLKEAITAKYLTLGLSEDSDILFRNFRTLIKYKTHQQ